MEFFPQGVVQKISAREGAYSSQHPCGLRPTQIGCSSISLPSASYQNSQQTALPFATYGAFSYAGPCTRLQNSHTSPESSFFGSAILPILSCPYLSGK